VSAGIRPGSMFKRFLCFVLIDIRCLSVPPGVRVPEVEDHCSRYWQCHEESALCDGVTGVRFWTFAHRILVGSGGHNGVP
jgi:hypothetical protein